MLLLVLLEVRAVLGVLSPVENNSLTVMFFGRRKQNQLNLLPRLSSPFFILGIALGLFCSVSSKPDPGLKPWSSGEKNYAF